jgi:hypothetical protein
MVMLLGLSSWRQSMADIRLWLPASIMTGVLVADLLRGFMSKLRTTAALEDGNTVTRQLSYSKRVEERIEHHLSKARMEVQQDTQWCEWAESQREARRQGTLSNGQIVYLDTLGFDWDAAK